MLRIDNDGCDGRLRGYPFRMTARKGREMSQCDLGLCRDRYRKERAMPAVRRRHVGREFVASDGSWGVQTTTMVETGGVFT
jgi:hypothetical protein